MLTRDKPSLSVVSAVPTFVLAGTSDAAIVYDGRWSVSPGVTRSLGP